MSIKIYKTDRAARKRSSIVRRADIHRGHPWKTLTVSKKRGSGRGNSGTITVRHRGGGAKRLTRVVDFGQDKVSIPARVERVEYDPNRSALLVLLRYADGDRRYRLAWEGAKVGDAVLAGDKVPEAAGNRTQLARITPGLFVHDVELKPNRGGKLFRSAGSYGTLMDVQNTYAQIRMPSGEIRLIPKESYATIGQVGNADWRLQRIGSAGRSRRMGRRPAVRGKAMNPVDHPHGGGEGNQPIGLKAPKTAWGKKALGVKTRRPGKYSDALILERRPPKKKKK